MWNNKNILLRLVIRLSKNVITGLSKIFTSIIVKIKNIKSKKNSKQKFNQNIIHFDKTAGFFDRIKIVSLKKIFAHDTQIMKAIQKCQRIFIRQIAGFKLAVKVFLKIPLVIKEDFHKLMQNIKRTILTIADKLLHIYWTIIKKYKYANIKRLLVKLLKWPLGINYNLLKKSYNCMIFLINLTIFFSYKLYHCIYAIIYKVYSTACTHKKMILLYSLAIFTVIILFLTLLILM